MKSTCGGGNRLRDEILLRREKEDGFDFIQGGSLGFHLNEVKISSWLDTISSESRKRENRMDFHFVLSLLFIASFAFVLQMHRAAPIPLSYLSDKDITHWVRSYCFETLFIPTLRKESLPSEDSTTLGKPSESNTRFLCL